MTTFFQDNEKNNFIREFIHENFGKRSGLMIHEYMIHFKPDLEWHGTKVDFVVTSGKILHIAVSCLPTSPELPKLLRDCFKHDLKSMLRSYALVKKEDAEKWYALAIKDGEQEINMKKVRVNSFVREIVISIKLTDRITKKSVLVDVVNGDAFNAQEKALKLLYGERLI